VRGLLRGVGPPRGRGRLRRLRLLRPLGRLRLPPAVKEGPTVATKLLCVRQPDAQGCRHFLYAHDRQLPDDARAGAEHLPPGADARLYADAKPGRCPRCGAVVEWEPSTRGDV